MNTISFQEVKKFRNDLKHTLSTEEISELFKNLKTNSNFQCELFKNAQKHNLKIPSILNDIEVFSIYKNLFISDFMENLTNENIH